MRSLEIARPRRRYASNTSVYFPGIVLPRSMFQSDCLSTESKTAWKSTKQAGVGSWNLYFCSKILCGVKIWSLQPLRWRKPCQVKRFSITVAKNLAMSMRLTPLQFKYTAFSPSFNAESGMEVAQSLGRVSESQVWQNILVRRLGRSDKQYLQISYRTPCSMDGFLFSNVWKLRMLSNALGSSRITAYRSTLLGDAIQMCHGRLGWLGNVWRTANTAFLLLTSRRSHVKVSICHCNVKCEKSHRT